jgi:glyoxylase-like metal-dependent hydrolase (beta-lactamase superfamily II)
MPDTLQFEIIPVTPLLQNCTLLVCPASNTAALVDPGGDVGDIVAALERHGARLEKIFLTHGHLDHVGGTVELRDRYRVPVEGPHPDDAFWIEGLPMQAQMFGFPPLPAFTPDRWLKGGDTVRFGQVELAVRHCPGHTPGHVIFFAADSRLAMVGDVLFAGSIGRTDLPRGNHADLLRAIPEQLWPLGNDVRFIPGHGPMSTFGAERRSNPYVADSVLARR